MAEERRRWQWNAQTMENNRWQREDGHKTLSWRQETPISEAQLSGHASYRG